MPSFFVFLIFASELIPTSEVVLRGVHSTTFPDMCVDTRGSFYYRDFNESAVFKLDATGKLVFRFGMEGKGPGEMSGPFRICLIDHQKVLIVLDVEGRVNLFKTDTGKFLKSFNFIRCNQLAAVDDSHFISVGGMPGESAFYLYDLSFKNMKGFGISAAIDLNKPFTRHYSTTVYKNHVYYAEGTYPEVEVIEIGSKLHKKWSLKQPKNYTQPPSKPISKAVRFSRQKVDEYYSSFTHLFQIRAFGNGYLAVSWALGGPYKAGLDIYQAEGRKILVERTQLPGLMIDALGEFVYLLEEKESDDGQVTHIVHKYQFKP